MKSRKEWALHYAGRGWPVFPCKFDKAPMTTRGVHEATTDIAQIERWWDRWPKANIGFHVGAAGMMALDYDPDGTTAEELVQEVADQYELPDTKLVSSTPRGGMHEFFLLPQDVRIPPSAGRIAPHVDVRSDASYVLLPPSATRDGAYTWEGKGKPAKAPQGLIEAASAKGGKRAVNDGRINVQQDQAHNVEAYIDWLTKKAEVPLRKQRNDTLAATAAMGHSYALTPETTHELIVDFWLPRLPDIGDFEHEEIEKTSFSGHRSATSAQGNMTTDYRKQKRKAVLERFRQDGAGDDQPDSLGRFRRYNYDQLQSRPDPGWIAEGVIPEGGMSIIYGPPSTFKSFIALDLALHLVTDKPDWHGLPLRPGCRALYCMGEGSFDAKFRIAAWLHEHDEVLDNSRFEVIEPAPIVRLPDDIETFLDESERGGNWDLLIMDTIGRCMAGLNDTSAEGARMFSEFTDAVRLSLGGCATLGITHSPKDKPDILLGSGAYEANADCVFNAFPSIPGHQTDLYQRKAKFSAPWEQAMGFRPTRRLDSIVMDIVEPQVNNEAAVEALMDGQFREIMKQVVDKNGEATWPQVRTELLAMCESEEARKRSGVRWNNWIKRGGKKYRTGQRGERNAILLKLTEE